MLKKTAITATAMIWMALPQVGNADERAFIEAAKKPQMDQATAAMVKQVVENVVVDNSFPESGSADSPAKEKLDVLEYNVEQGLGYDDLVLLLGDGQKFIEEKVPKADQDARDQILRSGASDIMIMSELDVGVCRTDYRDVPHDLAHALKMNYAYVTEFLELEPKDLGDQSTKYSCKDVDWSKTQNLTGDAILSRYPLENVHRLAVENCYDWYADELNPPWYKRLFFWPRQLRRGQRAALIADIPIGGAIGTVTVVSAHFEVNAGPGCRRDQMAQILDAVKDVKNPVIIAGDLNTVHIRGSERGLFKEWKKAGFDLSGNDGKGTDLNPWLGWLGIRLDHMGVRGMRVDNGETLTEMGKDHIEVSDHAPIAEELSPW